MEHFSGSDYSTVYHGPNAEGNAAGPGGRLMPDAGGPETGERVRAFIGTPRLFALVRHDEDEGSTEVVAYGIALPEGGAATIGVGRSSFGRWISAQTAATRLRTELVWVGQGGRPSMA
ncbi:hypothetical protein AB0K60_32995 [Thermopolyspora sp. NPDC052614]|uniref:hypothetical protein n=1 Tax=Thermopolyspora sp. NPDC052614 TaxID=3155682 RepID=UPI003422C4A0